MKGYTTKIYRMATSKDPKVLKRQREALRRSARIPGDKRPLFRWRKVAKRADDGRWCSMAHAIANPKTTMVLRVRIPIK